VASIRQSRNVGRVRRVAGRIDENGAAYAGSQLQTQLYVNTRKDDLENAVRAAFPELAEATLDWRSPLADDRYAEYWDAAFLDAIGLSQYAADLKASVRQTVRRRGRAGSERGRTRGGRTADGGAGYRRAASAA
jgi:hypothetical protein